MREPLPSHPSSPSDAAPPRASWPSLAAFGAITIGTVAAMNAGSGVARPSTLVWYRSLAMPGYKPPDPAIPAAWSVMYTLAAVSAWRVWRTPPSAARRTALAVWGAHLVLNGLWTRLFFGRRRPDQALWDSAALFASIGGYAAAASRVDQPAGLLMLPYLGWVGFATLLNADIVRLNRPGAATA